MPLLLAHNTGVRGHVSAHLRELGKVGGEGAKERGISLPHSFFFQLDSHSFFFQLDSHPLGHTFLKSKMATRAFTCPKTIPFHLMEAILSNWKMNKPAQVQFVIG